MSSGEDADERTHYHFNISLRLRHPSIDPKEITEELGLKPHNAWTAGEPRKTPKGTPLPGRNRDSFWVADLVAGRWPNELDSAIHEALTGLVPYKALFHRIRAEGGNVEFFVGWFFENQSGDTLSFRTSALAADLQIDLSFDVYGPDQPQNEYEIE